MPKALLSIYVLAIMGLALAHSAWGDEGTLLFPNSDFEMGSLENWRLEGDGFKNQPTKGDNVRARVPERQAKPQGNFWASSYENYQGKAGQKPGRSQGDKAMGGIISTTFIIEKPYIGFLISGGHGSGVQTQLVVQGKVERSASGAESPLLRVEYWDVSALKGQQALIYVFDRSSETWSQIGVDDFRAYESLPNLELFPNSDFELGELGNWSVEGDAFATQPTKGDNVAARTSGERKSGHDGAFWIGTHEKFSGKEGEKPGDTQGDDPKGTLTSMPFEIKGDTIIFRVGGGKSEKTQVQLLVDGKKIYGHSGANSPEMRTVTWDVVKHKGRMAEIKVIDDSAEEWGFINCDSFRYARMPGDDIGGARQVESLRSEAIKLLSEQTKYGKSN